MKRNKRVSRYYDLTKNVGPYTGSSDLIGWWNFSTKDIGKAVFIDRSNSTTGSFIQGVAGQDKIYKPRRSSFETPSFLKGEHFLRNASVTISDESPSFDPKGFQISSFPDDFSTYGTGFTISMTFKYLQQYNLPIGAPPGLGGKVELLTVCDELATGGRIAVIFDNDGYSSLPSLGLMTADNSGTVKRWNCNPGPAGIGPLVTTGISDLRGWQRIDLVVTRPQKMSQTTFPNLGFETTGGEGAALYFNGRQVAFDTTGLAGGTYPTSRKITKVIFGALDSTFSTGLTATNRIQLGECIIWNTALGANDVSYLYDNTQDSHNSGILSSPVYAGSYCGECEHDEYPTIERSGDSRRLGKKTPIFDDTIQNAIPVVGDSINYPSMLAAGSQADWAVGTIIATPNTLPTIYAPQDAQGIQGRANIITSYQKCTDKTDASDGYHPFNDASAPVQLATRVAQLHQVAPGFSSHAGERIIIDIDVTPKSAKILQVITGSNGDTFGDHPSTANPDTTGLAYFNFVNASFESVGGQNKETGTRIAWCLPGQVSSSYTLDVYPWEDGLASPTNSPQYQGDYGNPGIRLALVSQATIMEDWSKIPRIFQPYSSIIAHRGTFNHVHERDWKSFNYFAGRMYALTASSDGEQNLWENLTGMGTAGGGVPPRFFYDGGAGSTGKFALGYGGYQNTGQGVEFAPYSSDVRGRGWQNLRYKGKANVDHDYIDGEFIWSKPNAPNPWATPLRKEYLRTFSTMGRPVAYTNWCRNPTFHASSSLAIKMSDYINSPMVLESWDIKSAVKACRLQQPMSGTVPNTSTNTPNIPRSKTAREMIWWSNTNNHIDMLTFFLLKQSNPFANSPVPGRRSGNSVRELISFSNHIFSSPWIGWDWMNRIHLTKNPVDTTHGTGQSTPVGGARCARAFHVEPQDVIQNVPGVDSFTYYLKEDGGIQQCSGSDGVFFAMGEKVAGEQAAFNGVPLNQTDIGVNADMTGPARSQPQRRWVTASIDIDINVPVRTPGAYAQKSTTILPAIQSVAFRRGGAGRDGPYFITDDSFMSPIGTVNGHTYKPNVCLPSMGTYWPGGSLTSREVGKIPSNLEYFSASILGLGGKELTDTWTLPIAAYAFKDRPDLPNALDKFKFSQLGEQMARAFAPSTRLLKVHSGTFVIDEEQIGGFATEPFRTVAPSDGLSYNSSFLVPGNYSKNRLAYPTVLPNPQYLNLDFTGSDYSQETGYILLPEDELIFGVQWSPADAVHRDMKSIRLGAHFLKFRGYDSAALPPLVTGSLSGPREPDKFITDGVYNIDLVDDCLYEIASGSEISTIELASQKYRHVGFCESNDLKMLASASCEILQKPMRLRLYGTLIRDGRQQRHSLPQQLTTNCVHEVVGNETIVDQYQLGSFNDLKSSSTIAKQVSGSMWRGGTRFYGTNSWDNQFITSVAYSWGDRRFPGRGVRRRALMDNFADIFALRRTRRLTDLSEYYYDSLAPSVPSAWAIDGATYDFQLSDLREAGIASTFWVNVSYAETFGGCIPINREGEAAWSQGIGLTGQITPNRMWGRSFPFEPRYSTVQRVFNQKVLQAGYAWSEQGDRKWPTLYSASIPCGTHAPEEIVCGFTRNPPNAYTTYLGSHKGPVYRSGWTDYGTVFAPAVERTLKSRAMSLPISASDFGTTSDWLVRRDFYEGSVAAGGLLAGALTHIHSNFDMTGSNKTLMDGYFGVGDNFTGALSHYYVYLEALQGTNSILSSVNKHVYARKLLCQKPRGYKYGLISSVPKRLSAVFRNDSYGQFRDMLEQRHYTSLFLHDPGDVAASRNERGLQRRTQRRASAAVQCSFRTPVWENPTAPSNVTATTPNDTNCSNLSNEMTSSLPYFDGVLKNRDSAPTTDTEVIVS